MRSAREVFKAPAWILAFLSFMPGPGSVLAQEKQMVTPVRDTLIAVAREYMQAARYCALITVDSTGQPHVRTMDPFPPDESMIVWFGTNRRSRKLQEIRNHPRVTLYYSDDKGVGYVAIMGTASLVDDPKEKAGRWKGEWEEFYKDQKESYLLFQVIPGKFEIVNYKHGILGDPGTWRTPAVEFNEK